MDEFCHVFPGRGHSPGGPVKENEIPSSCTKPGSYDEVIYCTVCGREIRRRRIVTEPSGHSPGAAVVEDEVVAGDCEGKTYHRVVYCTVCGAMISRERIIEEG